MSIREIGTANTEFPDSLPVFSTDTKEQARDLLVLNCKLQYDGTYCLTTFSGEIEDLNAVGERLSEQHEQLGAVSWTKMIKRMNLEAGRDIETAVIKPSPPRR